MADRIAVLMFAEHLYEDIKWFSNVETARAFSEGVHWGGEFYGDSCWGYVMPEEEEDMRREPHEEVERALKDFHGENV